MSPKPPNPGPPNPPGPPTPPPNPQKGRKRRMEFTSPSVRSSYALGLRLNEQGISYDVIPRPGQATVVKAYADPAKHSKASLPKDLAKGLGVEVTADETDPA